MSYQIIAYDSPTSSLGTIMHDPRIRRNISAGTLTLKENDISEMTLTINRKNPMYGKIRPFQTYVKVFEDNELIFQGRALKPTRSMSSDGLFTQTYIFEEIQAFLLDSVQRFREVHNTSVADFFRMLISVHNSQVPSYKQFKVRRVTATNSTDNVYRFVDYEDTWHTIKDKLISRIGGYLNIEITPNGNYIDYLADKGEDHQNDMPIKITKNLKSSTMEIDPMTMITRLIPLGATVEQETSGDEINPNETQAVANPRVTISDVNGGKDYLDIPNFKKEFGIVNGTVVWDDVHEPTILLAKARQWINEQTAVNTSWTVETVDIPNTNFSKFKVSDRYLFVNPEISEPQLIRVIEKQIDFANPNSSKLTIGDKKFNLSTYQKDANRAARQLSSLNSKIGLQSRTLRTVSEEAKTATSKIESTQKEVGDLQKNIDNGTADITKIKNSLKSINDSLKTINESLTDHDGRISSNEQFITLQKEINYNQAQTNNDVETRLQILEKGGNTSGTK